MFGLSLEMLSTREVLLMFWVYMANRVSLVHTAGRTGGGSFIATLVFGQFDNNPAVELLLLLRLISFEI